MLSVTADTNIWVSALTHRGNPRRLIDMAEAGQIRLDISDAIIDETRRILGKRFRWAPDAINEAEAQMRAFGNHVTPTKTLSIVPHDPDDNRIVECAVEAGSDYLVTGDNDLLGVRGIGTVQILKVADFLKIAQMLGR